MARLGKIYHYANLLSLDVAAGAICSALFFARLLSVTVRPVGLISLGLTVWIIYTADHLLDARKVDQPAATERHRFHQHNYAVLLKIVLVAAIIDGVVIFFIRRPVFMGGVVLSLGVGLYLIVQRYIKFFKEIFIAILYTGGVLLPSVLITHIPFTELPWVLIIQFALTALINLLLFSWFDRESDAKDGATSFVTVMGEKKTRSFIWLLFVLVFFLALLSIAESASYFIMVMNIVLAFIFARHNFFSQADRFRLVGDAVFFVPILYLLW